jgi:hypothetical protein
VNRGANRRAFAGTMIQHSTVELNNSQALLIAWYNTIDGKREEHLGQGHVG